jgi:hypothetical protein
VIPNVAALYVDTACGPYPRIFGVECWGFATRDGRQADIIAPNSDARDYDGPHPVVAHPPCGPWGRFAWHYKGGEGAASCGPRAIEQVRTWGGVLEHPEHSRLWIACGLPVPGDEPDEWGGRTVTVRQCDWGHPAAKPTWLYVVGGVLPPAPPPGTPTHVMVRLKRNNNDLPELSKSRRHITPPAFASWLVQVARSAIFSPQSGPSQPRPSASEAEDGRRF